MNTCRRNRSDFCPLTWMYRLGGEVVQREAWPFSLALKEENKCHKFDIFE